MGAIRLRFIGFPVDPRFGIVHSRNPLVQGSGRSRNDCPATAHSIMSGSRPEQDSSHSPVTDSTKRSKNINKHDSATAPGTGISWVHLGYSRTSSLIAVLPLGVHGVNLVLWLTPWCVGSSHLFCSFKILNIHCTP